MSLAMAVIVLIAVLVAVLLVFGYLWLDTRGKLAQARADAKADAAKNTSFTHVQNEIREGYRALAERNAVERDEWRAKAEALQASAEATPVPDPNFAVQATTRRVPFRVRKAEIEQAERTKARERKEQA